MSQLVASAVFSEAAPRPIGPYSQAVRLGDLVFVSGQIPIDWRTGGVVAGGIAEQTEQVIANLQAILEAAGLGLGDVVKTTVFLADLADFPDLNAVYARCFTALPLPARSTVQVAGLPAGARLEIEAIATAQPRQA